MLSASFFSWLLICQLVDAQQSSIGTSISPMNATTVAMPQSSDVSIMDRIPTLSANTTADESLVEESDSSSTTQENAANSSILTNSTDIYATQSLSTIVDSLNQSALLSSSLASSAPTASGTSSPSPNDTQLYIRAPVQKNGPYSYYKAVVRSSSSSRESSS